MIGGNHQLAKQFQGKAGWFFPGIFHDDLHQADAGQVFAGLRVEHLHLGAISNQGGDFLQIDVPAGRGVV